LHLLEAHHNGVGHCPDAEDAEDDEEREQKDGGDDVGMMEEGSSHAVFGGGVGHRDGLHRFTPSYLTAPTKAVRAARRSRWRGGAHRRSTRQSKERTWSVALVSASCASAPSSSTS